MNAMANSCGMPDYLVTWAIRSTKVQLQRKGQGGSLQGIGNDNGTTIDTPQLAAGMNAYLITPWDRGEAPLSHGPGRIFIWARSA